MISTKHDELICFWARNSDQIPSVTTSCHDSDCHCVVGVDSFMIWPGPSFRRLGNRFLPPVEHERFAISERFEGSVEREMGLSELGSTRHQSAAQFVFDQKDAIAIVASQGWKAVSSRMESYRGKGGRYPAGGVCSVIEQILAEVWTNARSGILGAQLEAMLLERARAAGSEFDAPPDFRRCFLAFAATSSLASLSTSLACRDF